MCLYILLPRVLANIQLLQEQKDKTYPEFIVTGNLMTSRSQGSLSKKEREPLNDVGDHGRGPVTSDLHSYINIKYGATK